ncbi:hypothetical protein L6164_033825 [Bauhinia variegata]|uniref:Uncharacterized protein n=1 Tax=Bauhinia variegata TaxID=167791 RepID=A0ACB9KT65_BAUVA|nr:hypothetical protein L6164_033825 [Bauhinia variegata]
MDSHEHIFSLLFLSLILLFTGADASGQHLNFRPTKLFVFGDSYVDTGNHGRQVSFSWKDPYGITFPGKPSGRFSDGRVLTDFIAKYLGVKSPVPYKLRRSMAQHLKYGMNFAYGGTGVFDTSTPAPNMTNQIDLFQQLIKDKAYTAADLSYSVALVSVAGNDYSHYINQNGSAEGFPSFIASVVNEMASNLKRIHELGVKKLAVSGLQPLGCLPANTAPSTFRRCNDSSNVLVAFHNSLLTQAVSKLNQQTKDQSTFVLLDLYNSFMSVLAHPSTHNIQNQFQPCCVGVSSGYSCGDVDDNNFKKYNVCDDPKSAFFWDLAHPTQAGWHAVYNKLQTTNVLQQLVVQN